MDGVVVGGKVLSTNKFGVLVGPKENGVTVGLGELGGTGVCRKGTAIGAPEHPERRTKMTRK